MYDMSNYGKVIQLLLLEGIYILHIITLKIALIFSDKVIGLYLLQFWLAYKNLICHIAREEAGGMGSNYFVFNHDQGKESMKGQEKETSRSAENLKKRKDQVKTPVSEENRYKWKSLSE